MPFPANPLSQFTPRRVAHLVKRLESLIWTDVQDLTVEISDLLDAEVPIGEAASLAYQPLVPESIIGPPGGSWQQRWLRLSLPAADDERHLLWDADGEATVYADNRPWSGLDPGHRHCRLPAGGGPLYVDLGTYQTAFWCPGGELHGAPLRFRSARVASRNAAAWKTYWDLSVLREWLDMRLADDGCTVVRGPGYTPTYEHLAPVVRRALAGLDQACDAFDRSGLAALQEALDRLYGDLRGAAYEGRAGLIGHAHMDLVWLWPERVTERKGVHFFSTVLRLMERYPELTFLQSQPSLYDMVAARSPDLLDQVRARIAEGRWEATGAMEVEADTVIPCGEALARNLIDGQRRFVELCGRPSRVLWLPDVFGYSACLPQMLNQVGVERFFTTKIAWSNTTRFPYTSLVWRGHDGSEVLTHLCKVTYNGGAQVNELVEAGRVNDQIGLHDEMLLPIGLGDGGGGPTEEQLERARRQQDLSGVPQAAWTRAEDFFDRLEESRAQLPSFQGELYLELHRGTYTTQGAFKLAYRQAEAWLLAREAAAVLRGVPGIDHGSWRRLAMAQFHDAIPGSSIAQVYQELGEELRTMACDQQAHGEDLLCDQAPGLRVFNPCAHARQACIALPQDWTAPAAIDDQGRCWPVQQSVSGPVLSLPVAGLACASLRPDEQVVAACPALTATPDQLDNGRVRAIFNPQGWLTALSIDGQDLAITATALHLYPDHPSHHPAWDIEREALALAEPLTAGLGLEVVEEGPARAVLAGQAALGRASQVRVRYLLEAGADHLRIEMDIDWQEDDRLLKYHVLTGYRGRMARFAAPFGSVQRSQQAGLPHEEAQFETCFNRWLAVTDDAGVAGLALITQAKYGVSLRDGDLGLSLLRAPSHPDPRADRGQHRICWALSAWRPISNGEQLSTAAQAEALFAPVLFGSGPALPAPFTLQDPGSLVIAAVKPAQAGSGYVIRLHECAGGSGQAGLRLGARARCRLVNLLEEAVQDLTVDEDGTLRFAYGPYQILSVLVEG